jgi:hypothetical protein
MGFRESGLSHFLAPGTRLAKPPRADGCWGVCTHEKGRPLVQPRQCAREARRDRITCVSHRALEGEAQALKNELEAALMTGGEHP